MPEVVAKGLTFPEGPVLMPDGTLTFVEQGRSRISVLRSGGVETYAETGGSPNGLTLGAGDRLFAAQNGGVVGAWRAPERIPPGIQRIHPDGTVEVVVGAVNGEALTTPNDLCFGPDGRLYFTDPSHGYDPADRGDRGRVFAIGGAQDERIAAMPRAYTNGIGWTIDGRLIWAESYDYRLYTVGEVGEPVLFAQLPEDHAPDGFAVAADGRIFVASVMSHGVTIVSPEGEYLGHIKLDDQAICTNCCFDGSTLWVTDFGGEYETNPAGGQLWRVDTDATGAPMHTGAL